MTTADHVASPRIADATRGAHDIVAWFNTRPTLGQWVALLMSALVFQLLWSAAGIAIVASLGSTPQQASTAVREMLNAPLIDTMAKQSIGILIEELCFRLVPLGIALAIYRDNGRAWIVAAIVVVSSVAFGLFHGLEWYRLALQAVGGIVLSAVYLKACGMSGDYWFRALASAFVLHLAINTSVLMAIRLAQS